MIEFETKTRKWGNSLGIIIPKNEVDNLKLKENEILHLIVIKKNIKTRRAFGLLKNGKSGQEVKDLLRKELYG